MVPYTIKSLTAIVLASIRQLCDGLYETLRIYTNVSIP
jgi:hypothetical protein